METFLDHKIHETLRENINATDIFFRDESQKPHFNLFCAVMDRVSTCVTFLNKHSIYPANEEAFIMFMVFGCMLRDATYEMLKKLGINLNETVSQGNSYQYFRDICRTYPFNLSEDNLLTDDQFFAYFRSLVFAHPCETSRAKCIKNGEVQYSPFVIVRNDLSNIEDPVGVRVYSTKSVNMFDIIFSFSLLKEYINSRYRLLSVASERIQSIITEKQSIWKEHKVNRNLSAPEILKDIINILKERCENYDYMELALSYLETQTNLSDNRDSVEKFHQAIINALPNICNAIDDYDTNSAFQIIGEIVCVYPDKMHENANYELEKIFCNLNEYCDKGKIEWGLRMAEHFSQKFAKKWVSIQPKNMNFNEIKLLTATACYLEAKSQKEEIDTAKK